MTVPRLLKQDASVSQSEDPNNLIHSLTNERFKKLAAETGSVLRLDRESPQFDVRAKGLITAWDTWMNDFDEVFKSIKNPDGTWPPEYLGYSEYRGRAGQYRLDLIKVSGF